MTQTTLGELSIGGGSYGIGASAVDFSANLPAYLRITDIRDDGTLDLSARKSVADPKATDYMLSDHDIVFARTGNSTGRSYYYEPRDGEFAYAGFLIKFTLDPDKVNPRYIKYYAQSKPYWDWVASFNSGSTRGNINAKTYEAMPIDLPPREVQDGIVTFCDSLSNKIRVNQQTNGYLVESALSIWKRCVQQSSEHMTIGEAAKEVITGKTPPTKRTELYGSDYPFITIPDMHDNVWFTSTERCLSEEGNKAQPKKIVNRGTVLVSCIATLGLVGIVSKPSHFNQQINAVVPKRAGEEYFLYCALLSVKQTLLGIGATGSATLNVNKGAFSGIDIPWLDDKSMDEYIQTVRPLFEAIEANSNECLKLTSLRDALLPKLMSGEIDVSGIEVPTQPNSHLRDCLR